MWRPRSLAAAIGLLAICAFAEVPRSPAAHSAKAKEQRVYVCACLGHASCSCMSEAMTEGPCACGTQGGPPMQAVAANSNWAKHNRKVLAGPQKSK